MSKKQIRIQTSGTINEQIRGLLNKKVNLVMEDRTVVFGTLLQAENELLTLTNMRLKKIKVPLKKVVEIFTDIDA